MHLKQLLHRDERPVSVVPKPVIILLVIFLLLQSLFHASYINHQASIKALPTPFEQNFLGLFSLSDQIVSAKLIMLWLQSFDNQPGISIPFKNLDYDRLHNWLSVIQSLDEKSQYPLLSASRLYTQVPDETRIHKMLSFVREAYLESPDTRWRWMAHTVYVAKYRLEDLELALEQARIIRQHTSAAAAPAWVRQMEIYILEDMNEMEAAKILVGGMLESGEIKDEHEWFFLNQRLEELEEKISNQPVN